MGSRQLLPVALGALCLGAACASDDVVAGTDVTAPAIVAMTPAPGAQDVALAAGVSVQFSECFEYRDARPAIVLRRGSAVIAGTPLRAPAAAPCTMTFATARELDPGTEYAVDLHVNVRDTRGNVRREDRSWHFRTMGAGLAALRAPALLSDIAALADDAMLGRGAGTADELRAAAFLRGRLRQAGLAVPAALNDHFQSFPLPPLNGRARSSQNVLGVLPGSGALKQQWVVVGAHYDHLGSRSVNGRTEIYNGADDNASGSAALLNVATELARYFESGALAATPRRSILFAAFGAEELGLYGSEWYCAHPIAAPDSVAAMLNFDMVGRMQGARLYVGGLHSSPEWAEILDRFNAAGLDIEADDCSNCSDHACFRRAQRPALWFFTGLHADYHKPSDDVAAINETGLAAVSNLALRTVLHLALRTPPLAAAP